MMSPKKGIAGGNGLSHSPPIKISCSIQANIFKVWEWICKIYVNTFDKYMGIEYRFLMEAA